ncbi:hypothetical protein [Sinorhizobium medicae]|uniref:hypothetical protein n=1 Tax=Sinorhizobium medicae TaxID=110321 RepID=UPI0013E32CE2|nr:hypothetical protein [Sinorhizobium medicae]
MPLTPEQAFHLANAYFAGLNLPAQAFDAIFYFAWQTARTTIIEKRDPMTAYLLPMVEVLISQCNFSILQACETASKIAAAERNVHVTPEAIKKARQRNN